VTDRRDPHPGVGARTVASIETRLVSMPLSGPLRARLVERANPVTSIESVLVRVTADDGATGHGYVTCLGSSEAAIHVAALDHLRPMVLGRPIGDFAAIAELLRWRCNLLGPQGVMAVAVSGIDMALRDVFLRSLDVSLSDARGRCHDTVPAYWSGLFLGAPEQALVDEIEHVTAAGYRGVKMRVGSPNLGEDLERVRFVRERLPSRCALMLDAAQAWAPDEAIAASHGLAEFEPVWLEDPVRHDDPAALTVVLDHAPLPIATGENQYLVSGFEHLDRRVRYWLPDLQRLGGLDQWDAVVFLAAERGAVVTPHAFLHIGVQLMSSISQAVRWIEHLPWWDQLMRSPLRLHDGEMAVPDGPGIGLDFDDDAVEALALTPWTE
jgi:L-alanine-DL-glutamate epimerase-like enolase superfamily enzyme